MTTRKPRKRRARVASDSGRPRALTQEERRFEKYKVQNFLDAYNRHPVSVMKGVKVPEGVQTFSPENSSLLS